MKNIKYLIKLGYYLAGWVSKTKISNKNELWTLSITITLTLKIYIYPINLIIAVDIE